MQYGTGPYPKMVTIPNVAWNSSNGCFDILDTPSNKLGLDNGILDPQNQVLYKLEQEIAATGKKKPGTRVSLHWLLTLKKTIAEVLEGKNDKWWEITKSYGGFNRDTFRELLHHPDLYGVTYKNGVGLSELLLTYANPFKSQDRSNDHAFLLNNPEVN